MTRQAPGKTERHPDLGPDSPPRVHHNPAIRYRRDIDGLRAVAVLPVILFHAGFEYFSGGYVGVDVFFVISGYLITSILLRELETGKYSIIGFYERRARRILPALFFVVLCCLPVAWFLLFPDEIRRFGYSLIAVSLFLSNVYFWLSTDYFDPAAELQPLLHTWSLAVEEQYYVLFPLLLWALWRLGRRRAFLATLSLLVVSLAFSQVAWHWFPKANFYLLPSRAWELLVGSCLAFWMTRGSGKNLPVPARLVALLPGLGLGMIAFAIFTFDENSSVPGIDALVPTLGAGLVIAFGSGNDWGTRLLSSRPLVGVGLISYSAYLWHQPLLAFLRLSTAEELSAAQGITIAVLSLLLAYLTWRYVETPFRQKERFARSRVFRLSGAGIVAVVCLGLAMHLTQGRMGRFGAPVTQLAAELKYRLGGCDYAQAAEPCVIGSRDAVPSFVLWGDSHAGALAPALDEAARQQGAAGWLFSASACPPLPGTRRLDVAASGETDCMRLTRDALAQIVENQAIRTVVIYARWTLNLEGTRYDNGLGGREHGRPALLVGVDDEQRLDDSQRIDLFKARLRDLLQKLGQAGKRVILVYPTPEFGWDVLDYSLRKTRLDFSGTLDLDAPALPRSLVEARQARTLAALDGATDGLAVDKVDPLPLFCGESVCSGGDGDQLWFHDDDHLSIYGARRLVSQSLLSQVVSGGR